jgi:hypothetical protein
VYCTPFTLLMIISPTEHRRSSRDLRSEPSPLLSPALPRRSSVRSSTSKSQNTCQRTARPLFESSLNKSMISIENHFVLSRRCLAKVCVNHSLKALGDITIARSSSKVRASSYRSLRNATTGNEGWKDAIMTRACVERRKSLHSGSIPPDPPCP